MKQAQFEALRQEAWQEFESLLKYPQDLPTDIGRQYRHICQDLSLAKDRIYSNALIQRLNHIASEGRQLLYQRHHRLWADLAIFLVFTLPQSIGRNWSAILWAHALFYLSGLVVGTLCYRYPEFIYSVMPPSAVFEMEAMYDPRAKLGAFRDSTSDFMMFGYYIYNNIGIGLQVYTTGLIFGIGTVITTLVNGLYIGAIFGHMAKLKYTTTFFPFVVGHGAFELTGICLAAAAGLAMGKALMFPGTYSRKDSIRIAGKETLPLVIGVIVLLVAAAFVEAFWSSSSLDNFIKYVVGTSLWVIVLGYLVYCKRTAHGS